MTDSNRQDFSASDNTRPFDSSLNGEIERAEQAFKTIGDYEIFEEIARGGMGVVYRARQRSLNRIVALKMIRQSEFASDSEHKRFRNEAEAAATLDHPNTVPIYDIGEHDGNPYFSMRLIDGPSLAIAIDRGDWKIADRESLRRIVRLVSTAALAVHDAHQHGIIHRDLKPGNILLDSDGTPYVADFGLAKRIGANDMVTQTGLVVGTPAYMSPEQASGFKNISTATDVYSLGAILYKLLTGQPPFQDLTPMDFSKCRFDSNPTPVRKLNRLVDLDLATICGKCLEREPSQRYSSAQALSEDLERWNRSEPITARPISVDARVYRTFKRNPVVGGLIVVMLALIFVALWMNAISNSASKRILDKELYKYRIWEASTALASQDMKTLRKYLAEAASVQANPGWEWQYLRNHHPAELFDWRAGMADLSAGTTQCAWSNNGKYFAVTNVNWPSSELQIWHQGVQHILSRVNSPEKSGDTWPSIGNQIEPTANFQDKSLRPHGWLSFSEDGSMFAISNFDATEIRSTQTNKIVNRKPIPSILRWNNAPRPEAQSWSHQGHSFASVDEKDTFHVVTDLHTELPRQHSFALPKSSKLKSLRWNVDETQLIVSIDDRTLFLNSQTGEMVEEWPFRVLAWNIDSTRWIGRNGIGSIESKETQILVAPSVLGGWTSWSPDSKKVACSFYKQGDGSLDLGSYTLRFIDTETGKTIDQYAIEEPDLPRWFPSSDKVMIGAMIFPLREGARRSIEFEFGSPINCVAASQNGEKAAVSIKSSNTIQIVDDRGNRLLEFSGHSQPVAAIDWSHDNNQIASLDVSGHTIIWSSATGSPILSIGPDAILKPSTGSFPRFVNTIYTVFWSADDRFLSGSIAGQVGRVWDARTGKIVYSNDAQDIQAIGWIDKPATAYFEAGEVGLSSRFRTAPVGADNRHRLIGWDSQKGTPFFFSHYNVRDNNYPQFTVLDPLNAQVVTCSFQNGIYSDTLETLGTERESFSKRISELPVSTAAAGEANAVFVVTRGDLRRVELNEASVGPVLHSLKGPTLLSQSNGALWVSENKKLRLFDGRKYRGNTLGPLVNRAAANTHGSLILSSFPLLIAIVVLPFWIWLDRRILFGNSTKWLLAVLSCTILTALISIHGPISSVIWNRASFFERIFAAGYAIGIAGCFSETMRLGSLGRWWIAAALGLALLLLPTYFYLLGGYPTFTSSTYYGNQNNNLHLPLFYVFLPLMVVQLWGLRGALLASRAFHWHDAGSRSQSLQLDRAPTWVRLGLRGHRTISSAGVGIATCILVATLGVAGLLNMTFYPPQFHKTIFAAIAACIALAGISVLWISAAVIWLIRNGGWEKHSRCVRKEGPV